MDETAGSRTARVVAVGRAVGAGGARDSLVGALLPRTDRVAVAAARRAGLGRGDSVMAWVGHPALRMLAVDYAVVQAVAAIDPHSVVVLGAGWDTRAWRLEALAERRVVEVDHPATQAVKRARLGASAPPAADLVLAGADLAVDPLDEVLDDAGHDPAAPTVWLWEAVVPYLPAEAVDRTLAVLRRRSAPGSRLLVTTVTPRLFTPSVVGHLLGQPARWLMAALGEPVLSAATDAAFAARLERHGFSRDEVSGPSDWADRAGLALHGPQLDERLHVATRVGGP